MKGRRSPIDRMRELADDGLEPWQIAAALGVREDAVLVALAADEPAGGAQRAVEDASTLVPASDPVENRATPATWEHPNRDAPAVAPTKPDTLAPTRPMTRALAEHVSGYVRRCYCAPHPCSCDHEDGNDYSANSAAAGGPDPAEAARRARDEAADRVLDALDALVDEQLGDLDNWRPTGLQNTAAEVVAAPEPEEPVRIYPEPNQASAVTVETHLEALLAVEHMHDPFPVVDEAGVWHAECECGTRWDRAPCEYSGCTAYVAALHIARTGTSRHAHHPHA